MQIVVYLYKNKFEFYMTDFVNYVKNTIFLSLKIE